MSAQAAYQFRELQNTLEYEREQKNSLQKQISKLKDEIDSSRNESKMEYWKYLLNLSQRIIKYLEVRAWFS